MFWKEIYCFASVSVDRGSPGTEADHPADDRRIQFMTQGRRVRGRSGNGILIAVVGCDGSGKSTLTNDLINDLGARHKIFRCYLGLGSGNIRISILKFPVIGSPLERFVSKRADQSKNPEDKIPGIPTAIVTFLFTLKRVWKFNQAMRKLRQGYLVLTDRYPQVEFPGIYDGPLLSSARAEGHIVSWLAQREREYYEHMVEVLPDLIIKLHVDIDVALHRKPDHLRKSLARKIEINEQLKFNGARIEDIDANQPYQDVLSKVECLVEPLINAAA